MLPPGSSALVMTPTFSWQEEKRNLRNFGAAGAGRATITGLCDVEVLPSHWDRNHIFIGLLAAGDHMEVRRVVPQPDVAPTRRRGHGGIVLMVCPSRAVRASRRVMRRGEGGTVATWAATHTR